MNTGATHKILLFLGTYFKLNFIYILCGKQIDVDFGFGYKLS